jgi:Xaa-Pro aminopeptidase
LSQRLERLRATFDTVGARSFLVSNRTNVLYLTGLDSSNAFVLVEHKRVVVLTDGRYVEAARGLAGEGIEVVPVERDFGPGVAARLPELAERPVAFEADDLSYARHEALAGTGLKLVPTTGIVQELRAVKEPGELEEIRRSARVLNEAYERLAGEKLVGRTEREVAWWFEQTLREEGADDLAFDVIVASGPNAALPHHHTGEREIGQGETVLVDAGARLDGYCSDCTRTFATGPLPEDLRRAYAVCRSAQADALAEVRAGAESRQLDAIARSAIQEDGFEVLHGLGHGVGLDVHELPILRPTAEGTLDAGNVVTVEPGVYVTGRGGVRIEDLVIVGADGPYVLTPFTKDLFTLD